MKKYTWQNIKSMFQISAALGFAVGFPVFFIGLLGYAAKQGFDNRNDKNAKPTTTLMSATPNWNDSVDAYLAQPETDARNAKLVKFYQKRDSVRAASSQNKR